MDAIPSYTLYGENDDWDYPDVLHCESIRTRSRVHDWQVKPHRHDGLFQFLWVRKGGGIARVEDGRHRLSPSTAVLIPPLTVHGFDFDPGTDGWVVTVPITSLDRSLKDADGVIGALGEAAVLRPETAEGRRAEAQSLFAGIAAEHRGMAPGRAFSLLCLTGLLGLWFVRAKSRTMEVTLDRSSAKLKIVRAFQRRVGDCFREHRPVTFYAAEMGVTATHLSRICRDVLGRPASAVIQERLLLEAKRNLCYTSMSVAEISYALGFADPAYFTRFFAKQSGMTPSVFRNDILRRAPGKRTAAAKAHPSVRAATRPRRRR